MSNYKLDNLTEEQIQDYREVQDSLLIPLRRPATATECNKCTCCKRNHFISIDEPGGLYGPMEIPQMAGKVSTKIRR